MAIVGYIGGIGTGKTLNAVRDSIDTAARRRAILVSNIRIRPELNGGPSIDTRQLAVGHDGIDIEALRSIIDEAQTCHACQELDAYGDRLHRGPGCQRQGVVLLLDEVGVLMPARFWQDFPIDLVYHLSQSRKNGVDLNYTAQDVEQVDAILRRLTTYVWLLKSFPPASIARAERGRSPWLFLMTKWKAKGIEGAFRKPLGRAWRPWRGQTKRTAGRYSTYELVKPPAVLRERQERKRDRAARARQDETA